MGRSLRRLGTLTVMVVVLGALGVTAAWAVPPANDNFAAAIAVTSPSTTTGSNVDATTEVGEQGPVCQPSSSKSVWYSLSGVSGGSSVTIDTYGSSFDTVLSVWTGAVLGSLTSVACNDDNPFPVSKVTFTATAGETYMIRIGSFSSGAGGAITMHILAPPANDNVSGATAIGSSPYEDNSSNSGATLQVGEPRPCGLIGSTVWYSYTPADPGLLAITTAGSNYDTVLAVYSGTSLADLSLIECNDDAGVYPIHAQSMVGFDAEPGTTYFIQVGGYFGSQGNFRLRMSFGVTVSAPLIGSAGVMLDPDHVEVEANSAVGGSVVVHDGTVEEAYACELVVIGLCTP